MTMNINPVDVRLTPAVNEHKGSAGHAGGAGSANAAATTGPAATTAPAVELTAAGRRLADWVSQRDTSAGVDEAKVARLRVEIEHGSYRLDSTRIADGLIKSEKELLRLMDRGSGRG